MIRLSNVKPILLRGLCMLAAAHFAAVNVAHAQAVQPGRPVIAPATGSYRLAESTGVLTGVAAGTATAGHVFAWCWTTNTTAIKECLVKRIRLRWQTQTAFTAAQEVEF